MGMSIKYIFFLIFVAQTKIDNVFASKNLSFPGQQNQFTLFLHSSKHTEGPAELAFIILGSI